MVVSYNEYRLVYDLFSFDNDAVRKMRNGCTTLARTVIRRITPLCVRIYIYIVWFSFSGEFSGSREKREEQVSERSV